MARITGMLDTGKRSLMNSQTALQTVAHNIANKSTEGFSRQRVEIQSNLPIGEGNLRIGTGARAAAVTRTNNPYLEKQIQKEGAHLGYADGRAENLARVEQVYNEQVNKGLNSYVTDFFNSYRELSNNPESLATRTLVRETADFLTKDFARVNNELSSIQKDIDQQIVTHVEEINQNLKEVAQLNEKIQSVELQGVPANDERDRRDLLLKKLGEKLDISYSEGSDSQVIVTAGQFGVLVSGFTATELQAKETAERGRVEVFYLNNPKATPVKMTDYLKGGKVGGALDVRDHIIEDFKEKVDTMAYTMATTVNRAHTQGFDRVGRKGGEFFKQPMGVVGAAVNMRLSDGVANDVNKIVSAIKPNAPADNTVANVISSLQYKQVMDQGTATIGDFYNSLVGQVGVMSQRANRAIESQKNIMQQLGQIRESISGVSLDEETTKMIEFQKSYDASARLIRTADEMFDTVLKLKPM